MINHHYSFLYVIETTGILVIPNLTLFFVFLKRNCLSSVSHIFFFPNVQITLFRNQEKFVVNWQESDIDWSNGIFSSHTVNTILNFLSEKKLGTIFTWNKLKWRLKFNDYFNTRFKIPFWFRALHVNRGFRDQLKLWNKHS